MEWPPIKDLSDTGNKRLHERQELEICQYLVRLDSIGLPASRFMITDCANEILRCSRDGDPTISK